MGMGSEAREQAADLERLLLSEPQRFTMMQALWLPGALNAGTAEETDRFGWTDAQRYYCFYIISTVETGCDWGATNQNDAITVGIAQWYGTRAAEVDLSFALAHFAAGHDARDACRYQRDRENRK